MEKLTSSEPLDPLSHEASIGSSSRVWTVGDEEFLHMNNFDDMERERYYTNLINDESNHFGSIGEGRPMGRKKAKQQMRERSDLSRKESLDYLWDKKKEADAEKERKFEERYQIAFALEQKRIDLERDKFEFKRMTKEDKLLRTDTSAMSIEEQEYYKNVKNQILSRRSAQA
uniref:No apical meristem-associated C-terminal domain-containing protein n=1 Tax=Oryza nivara TaxID=4536 RepID=A0A0E0I3P5_ORYNI